MVHYRESRLTRGGLLAALCTLALGCAAYCAEPADLGPADPGPADLGPSDLERPDEPVGEWEYPADGGQEWLSPMPDHGAPPGRLFSGLPQHPLRHLGFGEPLQGTSWLNRPYYIGAFGGTWLGDTELISGQVEQGSGFFGGYWLGTDVNHYWGAELRASVFYVNTSFPATGQRGTESRNVIGDVSLLYYPWGDARWRPYGTIGLGLGGFHFSDADNQAVNHTGVGLPIGFGLKYLCRNWLALRLEIKDNIIFGGNDVSTTGNWSFIGGLEVHWGSKSSARYDPW